MPQIKYIYWLTPAELLKSRLQTVVRDLAAEFDAPVFEPHVTIYHGKSGFEEARSIAEELAAEFSPLDLEAQGLDQTDKYSKTLFVQFAPSAQLSQMTEAVRGGVESPVDYILNPHLSLLYKKLNVSQRKELCARPLVPMGTYHFDALQVVEFESPWSDKSAREHKVIAEYGLREGYRRRRDDMR